MKPLKTKGEEEDSGLEEEENLEEEETEEEGKGKIQELMTKIFQPSENTGFKFGQEIWK